MTSPRCFRPIEIAVVSFVLFGFSAASFAEKLEVPESDPVFSFEVPKDWKPTIDKGGDVTFEITDKTGYYMLMIADIGDSDNKAIQKRIPDEAKKFAEKLNMTDLETGDVETTKNDQGVQFVGIRVDRKRKGNPVVVVVHAFETKKGKWYAIFTAGNEPANKAHSDEYDSIYDSIETVK
jgi:hypothetical protein